MPNTMRLMGNAEYMREVANLCNGRLKVFGGAGESSLRGQRPDGHFTCEPNKVGGSFPQLFLAAREFAECGEANHVATEGTEGTERIEEGRFVPANSENSVAMQWKDLL